MSNLSDYPILCGGTFFTLLLEAQKPNGSERKKWGDDNTFVESDVFEALIKVAYPDFQKPKDSNNFGRIVSSYKSCSTSKSSILKLGERATIIAFDGSVRSDYSSALSAMGNFVDAYIETGTSRKKDIWLVKALLELIEKDKVIIPDSQHFYIAQDGIPATKDTLFNLTDICLPSFLLGIWHFIVTSRTDNSIGKSTYDVWCKPSKSPNTREPFESNIGNAITQGIRLIPLNSIVTNTVGNKPADRAEDETEQQKSDLLLLTGVDRADYLCNAAKTHLNNHEYEKALKLYHVAWEIYKDEMGTESNRAKKTYDMMEAVFKQLNRTFSFIYWLNDATKER